MPTFYPEVEDLDIDPGDYLDACSSREKQKLVEYLKEDGFINDPTAHELNDDLDKYIIKLLGKSMQLTKEEEQTIIKIANKII